MKSTFIVLAGVLTLGASLQAATSYTFNFGSGYTATDGTSPLDGGANYIGPYSGSTINGIADNTLICDDYVDNINFGQTGVSAYVTNIGSGTGGGGTLAADTRYGTKNGENLAGTAPTAANGLYPAGTTLYDELAWLAQQIMTLEAADVANGNTANLTNIEGAQQAMWQMTLPSTYSADAPAGMGADNYAKWILEAEYQVVGTGFTNQAGLLSSYSAVNYNNWYVVTDMNSAGCEYGAKTGGCTAGTAGTGLVTQEFLAYSTTGFSGAATPEPASFLLIGSGLLVGGLFGRRRMKKSNN